MYINLIFLNLKQNANLHLDYVTNEFEAIISCSSSTGNGSMTPPSSSSATRAAPNFNLKNSYRSDKTCSTFDHSGLPSPPLSTSPQRKNSTNSIAHMTPSSSTSSLNTPMPLRSYIEVVVKKSRMDTGTLLTSLCFARRLKLKLFNTSKGSYSEPFFIFFYFVV